MLRRQYRMHAGIMAFSSERFYDDRLVADPTVADHTLAPLLTPTEPELDVPPLLFLDTAGRGLDEALAPDSDSYRNPGEAHLIVARVAELSAAGLGLEQMGVITPYAAQVALLRERLGAAGFGAGFGAGLEVATVDAFQGREKEAILVSLCRSNAEGSIGFLADLRRMNVALTRARRHLFVVGDSATLGEQPFYAAFVEHAQGQGGYRSVWEWDAAEQI
jgi:superfamily I DNA and/or RNA helicase